jgi:hypothetical protein
VAHPVRFPELDRPDFRIRIDMQNGDAARRGLVFRFLAGVLIALFGLPLASAGAGVTIGVLVALAGLLFAWYALAGAFLFSSAIFLGVGLIRIYQPGIWDDLVASGHIRIQVDQPIAEFLGQLSPPGQGFQFVLLALVLGAAGAGMLWAGKRYLRGLRFLFQSIFNWFRRRIQALRERARDGGAGAPAYGPAHGRLA